MVDEAFKEAGHSKSARLVFRELDKIGVLQGTCGSDSSKSKGGVLGVDGVLLESKMQIDFNKGMIY